MIAKLLDDKVGMHCYQFGILSKMITISERREEGFG